ncbi:hypothetical protein E2542_SST28643 [Spatholobus suberectus]|nr:hypothetical protein E2542_SST28643 [Spatholobus suberectus]
MGQAHHRTRSWGERVNPPVLLHFQFQDPSGAFIQRRHGSGSLFLTQPTVRENGSCSSLNSLNHRRMIMLMVDGKPRRGGAMLSPETVAWLFRAVGPWWRMRRFSGFDVVVHDSDEVKVPWLAKMVEL